MGDRGLAALLEMKAERDDLRARIRELEAERDALRSAVADLRDALLYITGRDVPGYEAHLSNEQVALIALAEHDGLLVQIESEPRGGGDG